METKIEGIKIAFNTNREANMKAVLSLAYSTTDKAGFAKAAMQWMVSEEGVKAAFRYNGYSWDFANMEADEMIEFCEEASSTVMDTFCPEESAKAAKEGAAFERGAGLHNYGSKFRNA
jgi:hypothetical protein